MNKDTTPKIDVLLSPFDAEPSRLIDLAIKAEEFGFDGVWTYDHLTGAMFDRGHSSDVFTMLGAIAASTERVQLGPLVANVTNRHPVRLAVAANTMQRLSGGRFCIGLGGGASPGSRFSAEQEAIGITLGDGKERRARTVEAIDLLRAMWNGAEDFQGEHYSVSGFDFHLANDNPPPIIVGASGPTTAKVAFEHADGLNVASEKAFHALHDLIASERPPNFEVSVHMSISTNGSESLEAQLPDASAQVNRWVFAVSGDTDHTTLGNLFETASSKLR